MENKTYAVVDTLRPGVVVANFSAYDKAYDYVQTGWTYIISVTKRPVEVGGVIAPSDRSLSY